ncbi:WhiB family transcriptional regulator [Streptomyces sp. NBC_01717]|uniref:WhiB family transcriptional regulator n=1 Tax=Streptomyces sp. NBC_01717 TaxID=2975918 RepID=UPI002E2F8E1D|nr:WhiB family transcriptional regulator [Streptomyces sp. NBC_01717]
MIELPAFLDHGRAACTTDPDLFHSTHPTAQEQARTICRGCPLRAECADYALTAPEPTGTWGALTAKERRRILRPDDDTTLDEQGRVRVPCGSYKALCAHLAYGEQCEVCRDAQDARIEAQRRARLAEEHAAGGSEAGAAIHRRLGEPVCLGCLRAERAKNAVRRQLRRAAKRGKAPRPALALAS